MLKKIVVSHTVIHKEVEEAVKKTTAKSVKKGTAVTAKEYAW